MPLRLIEVCAPDKRKKAIRDIAEKHEAVDIWHGARDTDGRRPTNILVRIEGAQDLMDKLQAALSGDEGWRMNIYYVEATIPRVAKPENGERNGKSSKDTVSREELFNQLEKSVQMNADFFILVVLSALVCAIGLVENSVATVIGAMVIAPLLGPNLTFAFGVALGDRGLSAKAAMTNASGLLLALALSFMAGRILQIHVDSPELIARTHVGFDSIMLALASGAAAVLSLTTGLSSTLVGVMVAVALMPPAVTLGVLAGSGQWYHASGAALLLAANVVCVSIAAQVVFLMKGIKPRTWYMRGKSHQSVKTSLVVWVVLLVAVMLLIHLQARHIP